MKKVSDIISATLFAVLYPFCMISSSYSVDNFYFGFHGTAFTYIKYIIIFTLMFCLVYLNRSNERLFCVYVPAMMIIVAFGAYTDYFVTLKHLYNYAYLLWFGVVYSITNAGVFFGNLFFKKDGFEKFFKRFFIAYIPMYLLIFYVSFIRQPESFGLTINTVFGNGTLKFFKAVFNDPANNLYTSLICFGNILILMPLPFIIYAIKKLPPYIMLPIGIIIPILVEGYQYVFKCGNVDVDDIFLNIGGYLTGCIIVHLIYKKTVSPENG